MNHVHPSSDNINAVLAEQPAIGNMRVVKLPVHHSVVNRANSFRRCRLLRLAGSDIHIQKGELLETTPRSIVRYRLQRVLDLATRAMNTLDSVREYDLVEHQPSQNGIRSKQVHPVQ